MRQAHPGIVTQIRDGIAERGDQAVQDPDTDLIVDHPINSYYLGTGGLR